MFGPVDPSGVFYYGSPDDVREHTKTVLDIFENEGLVIGAGCALPPNVPEKI